MTDSLSAPVWQHLSAGAAANITPYISRSARVKGKVVSYRLIKIQTCPHKPAEGRFLLVPPQTITEVTNRGEIFTETPLPPLGSAHYYADSREAVTRHEVEDGS